ncbi:MAG: hypothetical protein U1F68_01925 [Gammaproteobacteria bacterium]
MLTTVALSEKPQPPGGCLPSGALGFLHGVVQSLAQWHGLTADEDGFVLSIVEFSFYELAPLVRIPDFFSRNVMILDFWFKELAKTLAILNFSNLINIKTT